jgi:hypothetical protein
VRTFLRSFSGLEEVAIEKEWHGVDAHTRHS